MESSTSYESDSCSESEFSTFDEISMKHKSAAESRAATYTCRGNGLLRYGHAYDQDIEKYIPPPDPTRTKAGTIRVNKLRFQKWPLDWWKAQCAFRGKSVTGKIGELQARLRSTPNAAMIKELRDLEKKANKEFTVKEAAAKVEQKAQRKARAEKAKVETRQFLEQAFPKPGATKGNANEKVIVVDADSHFELHECAASLGLVSDYFKPSIVSLEVPCVSWFVIGRKAAAVNKKMTELRIGDKKQVMELERKFEREEQREREAEEELTRKKRQKVLEAAGKSKDWDVTGSWTISCPKLEANWPDRGDPTLEIYWEKTSKGPQMYAKFNFGVIDGVFRFERQEGSVRKVSGYASKKQSKPAKRYSEEEDEDFYAEEDFYGEEDYGESRRSPTPEAFHLESPAYKPSAKHPKWNYRWRGAETGEGEIQLDSDKRVFEITFEEPQGTKLRGTIGCDLFKDCKFTGVKLGMGRPSPIDISEEWAERNESSYERARVGRWG